jgi:hypothetical protein
MEHHNKGEPAPSAEAGDPGFRNFRSLLLAGISLVVLAGALSLPAERFWLGHFLGYIGDFPRQASDCRLETRLRSALGLNYTIPTDVAGWLRPGDVFLLPPSAYVQARMGPEQSSWAEPKYFYYVAGPVRTMTTDESLVREATCSILLMPGGHLRFVRIDDGRDLDRVLQAFAAEEP